MLAKTSAPHGALEALLRDANVERLPAVMLSKLTVAAELVKKFHMQAKAITDAKTPENYAAPVDEVAAAIKDAGTVKQAVVSMLATMERIAAS